MTSVTNPLISSVDVNGTDVYNYNGEHIGDIDHLVIEKVSGKVAYAVIGFGGFLGMGEDHHPIPWGSLKYDLEKDGYVCGVTREQLEGAPERVESWDRDRRWEERTHKHYGVPYYWGI